MSDFGSSLTAPPAGCKINSGVQMHSLKRHTKKSKLSSARERGAVFIEAAIVAPLLILLMFAMCDFIFVGDYLFSLNQLAREQALTVTTISKISANGAVNASDYHDCMDPAKTPTPPACVQTILNWRVAKLAQSNGLLRCSAGANAGCLDSLSAQAPVFSAGSVKVSAAGHYTGFIPGVGDTPLSATAVSDYAAP